MKISLRSRRVPLSPSSYDFLEEKVRAAFDRFSSRIRLVDVRFEDLNGPRGGDDKVCAVEVTLWSGERLLGSGQSERVADALDAALARSARQLRRLSSRAAAARTVRAARSPRGRQAREAAAPGARLGGGEP